MTQLVIAPRPPSPTSSVQSRTSWFHQSGEAAASVTLVGPTSDFAAPDGGARPSDAAGACRRATRGSCATVGGRPGRSRRSGLMQCGSYWTAQAVQRTTGAVRGGFVTIPTVSCVHIGKETQQSGIDRCRVLKVHEVRGRGLCAPVTTSTGGCDRTDLPLAYRLDALDAG